MRIQPSEKLDCLPEKFLKTMRLCRCLYKLKGAWTFLDSCWQTHVSVRVCLYMFLCMTCLYKRTCAYLNMLVHAERCLYVLLGAVKFMYMLVSGCGYVLVDACKCFYMLVHFSVYVYMFQCACTCLYNVIVLVCMCQNMLVRACRCMYMLVRAKRYLYMLLCAVRFMYINLFGFLIFFVISNCVTTFYMNFYTLIPNMGFIFLYLSKNHKLFRF